MKIQYLTTCTIIALLSLGTLIPTAGLGPAPATANPYATKASTSGSVGGPLAKQLRGKPVVIDVYASWCPACKNVAPTLSKLKQQYSNTANFVVLDVTNPASVARSEAKAKQLGLSKFFTKNKSQTGLIVIVDPATGNILAQHRNNSNVSDYQAVLDAAIARR